jgi:hypothetical protein
MRTFLLFFYRQLLRQLELAVPICLLKFLWLTINAAFTEREPGQRRDEWPLPPHEWEVRHRQEK